MRLVMRKRPVYTALQKPHCISSPGAQVVTSDSGFPAPAICNEHPEIIQGPPIVTGPRQHCVILRSVTMSRKPVMCHDDITSVAPVLTTACGDH